MRADAALRGLEWESRRERDKAAAERPYFPCVGATLPRLRNEVQGIVMNRVHFYTAAAQLV